MEATEEAPSEATYTPSDDASTADTPVNDDPSIGDGAPPSTAAETRFSGGDPPPNAAKATPRLSIIATSFSSSSQLSPPRASAANRQLLLIKTSDSPSSIHSERARHQHTRKVTRDIAALDFLQNIPMKCESQVHAHSHHHHGGGGGFDGRNPSPLRVAFAIKGSGNAPQGGTDGEGGAAETQEEEEYIREEEGLAGRRLPGFEAKMVRLPPLFRYRMATKFPAASAVVRRWESMTAQQGLSDSRVFFSRGCGYPLAASTLLKYNGNETAASAGPRKRFPSAGNMEPMSYDWRGKSYYRLLHATWTPCDGDRDSQDDHPTLAPYVANYLDDPEFRQGRHRHVVRGDKNIGPVVSSILLFVKPNELKEELNKKFREKHTWLHDHELSLSKIRNLKRETLTTCQRLDMEVATVALACVYFEKLVLSHYVDKANRKLYMSVCLLLAAKFNEPKASDAMKHTIKQILAEIDVTHSLPSREVLTTEFKIYAQLSFSLHVPLAELQPHFTRLLKLVESNPRKYLDEDVFNEYSKLILEEKTVASRVQNEAVLSVDGETQDEGTDAEALLSDEDLDEEEEGMEDDDDAGQRMRKNSDASRRRRTLPPWRNMPSFAQWWRERTRDSDAEQQPPASQETDSRGGAEAPAALDASS